MVTQVRTRWGRAIAVVGAVVVTVAVAGCGSEPAPVTPADYLGALAAICTDTSARLDALPTAPEEITVADLATSAASALDNEATRVDRLDPPDPLADDHRAFVGNTVEQADAWRVLAGTDPGGGDLVEATDLIRQLVAGRNDLSSEMGVPDCRRDGL
jgi:hypothetical protein